MKKTPPSKPGNISPEDAALFRAAVGTVRPLPEQSRITPRPALRKPLFVEAATKPAIPDTLPEGSQAKGFSDFAAHDAPEEYLSDGLSRMTLRKLKRGNWPIQDSLDLHGNNSDAARRLLQEFLHEAMQRELRCVLVIHGKGLNSREGGAVLRKLARHWLTQHTRVLGYCDAQPKDGGSGAALVLLKANH